MIISFPKCPNVTQKFMQNRQTVVMVTSTEIKRCFKRDRDIAKEVKCHFRWLTSWYRELTRKPTRRPGKFENNFLIVSASSGNYYINHSRLNHHKNSFSIVGANIWNSIPETYRKLPKHIFKKKIQALLIVTLETLDSYADISTLIEIKKAS